MSIRELSERSSPLVGPRILVVEDDDGIRTLIGAILDREGADLVLARDGDEAVSHLRRERFDVVILDLMIAGPNGFEIIREIRSRDASLLGRTIVVTAASRMTLRDFTDASLLRCVLTKPFDIRRLMQEVKACAEASRTPEPYVH